MKITPAELFALLRMDPDPSVVLVPLIKRIDYTKALAAWDAAGGAAWDAAWDAARDAARGAAWDAAWGAGRDASVACACVVVHDLIDRKHTNFAVEGMCWWLQYLED